MSEEIKEILDKPKISILSYGNYISLDDYVKLKDCIIDLQKKLDFMIDRNDEKQDRINKAIEYLKYGVEPEEIEDLKERIDNAIEYINSHYDLGTEENVEFCILRDRVLGILKGE